MNRYQMYTIAYCENLQKELKGDMQKLKCRFDVDNFIHEIKVTNKNFQMVSDQSLKFAYLMQHRVFNPRILSYAEDVVNKLCKLGSELYNMYHSTYLHVTDVNTDTDREYIPDMKELRRIPIDGQVCVEMEEHNIAYQVLFFRVKLYDGKTWLMINHDIYDAVRDFRHYGTLIQPDDNPEFMYVHDDDLLTPNSKLMFGKTELEVHKIRTEEYFEGYDLATNNAVVGSEPYYRKLTLHAAFLALKAYYDGMEMSVKYTQPKAAAKAVTKHQPRFVDTVEIGESVAKKEDKAKKKKKSAEKCAPDEFTYVKLSSLVERKVRERKEWQGGHHKSPVPHDVSSHYRHYKNGKVILIQGYHKGKEDAKEVQKIVEVQK